MGGRGKGFGSIMKRHGAFQVRWSDALGKRRSKSGFPTRGAARAFLAEVQLAQAKGEPLAVSVVDANAPGTLRAAADAREVWLAKRGGRESAKITRDSKLGHPLAHIGEVPLGEITPRVLDKYLHRLGNDKTPGGVASSGNGLRALVRWCVKMGYMEQSQIDRVEWPIERRVRDQDERQVATPGEIAGLAAAMPPGCRLAVLLAAWCSMRQGEVLGLQRRDIVGLDNGEVTIQIKRQSNAKLGGEYTDLKTKAGRRNVAVPAALVPVIKDHLLRHTGVAEDAPLFHPLSNNTTPLHHNTLRNWWNKAREEVNLPWLRFHDLRHTGLTIYAQQGATLAELLERGGHADVEVALKYQHATAVRDRALTDQMNTLVQTPNT